MWGVARFTSEDEGDKSQVVRPSVLPTEDGTR
jgi:hypothetical protein